MAVGLVVGAIAAATAVGAGVGLAVGSGTAGVGVAIGTGLAVGVTSAGAAVAVGDGLGRDVGDACKEVVKGCGVVVRESISGVTVDVGTRVAGGGGSVSHAASESNISATRAATSAGCSLKLICPRTNNSSRHPFR